jgi:ankyrin repeat protein
MNFNFLKSLSYLVVLQLLVALIGSFLLPPVLMAEENIPYLLTVSAKGDLATVRAMLNGGTNPNVRDADGVTALMYAARKDQSEVVKALIENGADVNAKDNGGWTALMLASRKNHLKTAEVLLKNAADPTLRDVSGWSALGMACNIWLCRDGQHVN